MAVVVPAHNEEKLIAETIRGIPDFVDRIYVVDDASADGTVEAVRARRRRRVVAGRARAQPRRRRGDRHRLQARARGADRRDRGDGRRHQMDPADLAALGGPVARGEVDYAKANRLFTGQAWELIPRYRYLGNAVLSLLTKIASGYWHVADSQSGYTAISLRYLELLDLDRIYPRYGFPNDMLVHLNVWNARVRDFPSRPVYGVGERSGIRLRKVDPDDLVAAGQGLLLADAREVRHPRLPPARLLLRARHPDDARSGSASGSREVVLRILGNDITRGDDRARRAAADLGLAVHALRDVVRHGVEPRFGRPRQAQDRLSARFAASFLDPIDTCRVRTRRRARRHAGRVAQGLDRENQGGESGWPPDVGRAGRRQARPRFPSEERVRTMSTPPSMNLTSRAARWSAAHRRTAVLGWLAFVLVVVRDRFGRGRREDDHFR